MLKKALHFIRHNAFRLAGLSRKTSTGLHIEIENETEWRIYNDIFVDRDYDDAILKALSSTQSTLNILDLGFNVGFFTFRLIDLAAAHSYRNNLDIRGIEASSEVIKRAQQRINASDFPADNITFRISHGLIGATEGVGTFYHFKDHGVSSVFRKNGKSETLDFINVSNVVSDIGTIHLLKCDIEGSEWQFVRNYPDVLHKTQVAIFEFHLEFCNYDECIDLIKQSGLANRKLIRESSHARIELFWR